MKTTLNPFENAKRIANGAGGGSATIPPATADTIGGVKIGEGINVTEDGTISTSTYTPPAYSAEEVATGETWVDGKPIYCKGVNKAISQYGTVIEGVAHVVDVKGYFNDGRDHSINMYDFQIQSNSGTVQFGSSANGTLHCVIFYTKTGA